MTEEQTKIVLNNVTQTIIHSPKKRMEEFCALSVEKQSAVFNSLSPHLRQEILKNLSIKDAVELLDYLDLQRAYHVISRIKDSRRRRRIIEKLKNDLHIKVEQFIQFHPQATASLVNLNYVLLPDATKVGYTADIIKKYLKETGKIPEILVSKNGKLAGEVSSDVLVRERNTGKIGSYTKHIPSIQYNTDRKEIIDKLTEKEHSKVAILDTDKSVIGVVYSDDVIDLLGNSPAATLYSFAGVEESERPLDSIWSKVTHRYKWLILNLGTSFLAAGVVMLFEDTLTQILLLAAYMPIIAGMGGNAATQTLAVMVRGIAMGDISLKNSKLAVFREIAAGLLNGLITGAVVAITAVYIGHSMLLGLVAGVAVVASLIIAGFAGTIIPLIMKNFGKDPATSATIFITTATDVLGFLILLGLATLILL